MNPAFRFQGTLSVSDAATVMCLRQRKHSRLNETIRSGDFRTNFANFFESANSLTFESGWEVLMGQSEVQNWMRSTRDKSAVMRYPGEWKLAGGVVDDGERIADAAKVGAPYNK